MREKSLKIHRLLGEYQELKSELFGNAELVVPVPEDHSKWERFNQLLGFFYPQFRTPSYIDPIEGRN